MADEIKRNGPVYTGMRKYASNEGGYAVWLADDWRKIDMVDGRDGWIFTPYPDHFDTCFACEKHILDFKVTPEDVKLLSDGFESGIKSLPDVEILEKKYDSGKRVVILEAKFTFTENGKRRKRWVKSMYWDEANLVLMAQGADEEDYEYWLPMLFNAMSTYELGVG
jgi:hypothetical protein